jgi:hypothetical protein
VAFEKTLIFIARELRAANRVQDHRPTIGALPQCHQHRLNDHVPILTVAH